MGSIANVCSLTGSGIAHSRLAAERLAEVVARLVEVFAQSVGKVLAEASARQPAARRVHLEGVEQEGEVVGLERAAAAREVEGVAVRASAEEETQRRDGMPRADSRLRRTDASPISNTRSPAHHGGGD